MEYRRHVCRALYQEHQASLAVLARLETLLGHHAGGPVLDAGSAQTARLLKDLAEAVDREIVPHFAFEDEAVFPLLAAAGEGEMTELLTAEHRVIGKLAEALGALARGARADGFAAASWAEFHRIGAALAAQLAAHIEKEDRALLPTLDAVLDDEEDGRLAIELAARR